MCVTGPLQLVDDYLVVRRYLVGIKVTKHAQTVQGNL